MDRRVRKTVSPLLAHDEQILHIGKLYELPPLSWLARLTRPIGGFVAYVATVGICVEFGIPESIGKIVTGVLSFFTVFWAGEGGPNFLAVVTNQRLVLIRVLRLFRTYEGAISDIVWPSVSLLVCRSTLGWHTVSIDFVGGKRRRFWIEWGASMHVEDQDAFVAFLKAFHAEASDFPVGA